MHRPLVLDHCSFKFAWDCFFFLGASAHHDNFFWGLIMHASNLFRTKCMSVLPPTALLSMLEGNTDPLHQEAHVYLHHIFFKFMWKDLISQLQKACEWLKCVHQHRESNVAKKILCKDAEHKWHFFAQCSHRPKLLPIVDKFSKHLRPLSTENMIISKWLVS